ncbi:retrovirus-related pol polyprotein from transposon TNT 1-94 [Tanacetum coccineum]
MLEKHSCNSWKSIMELYMMNRPHGRMILASVEKGPLVWPTSTVDGVTRPKEYTKLTPAETIQANSKDIWEKIKLLMQGMSLTKQERECKLNDEFDKFTYKKGESLHEYYLRFTLLLNDMNIYKMPLEQFQSLPAILQQHQLREPSNLGNKPTINDGKGQGSYVKNATKPRRKRVDSWFKVKCVVGSSSSSRFKFYMMRGENEFLADPSIPEGSKPHRLLITHNVGYQADDLDAYDVIVMNSTPPHSFLMADYYSSMFSALAEVHNHDNVNNNMINQAVQVMPSSEQSNVVNHLETEITSDSNIIPYSQYVIESQQLEPKLYVRDIIQKTNPIVIPDSEETLMLAEKSHSKMLLKQKDPIIMEQAVNYIVRVKHFEVKMNQVLNDNEQLLEQFINKDIVNLIMNSSADIASVNVHECKKCLKLETELQTDFIEKEIYDKLFKSFTTLEKHCISLEVDSQLNQEIFQRDNSVSNQSAPSFDQLFELNELKAQSQEKDTNIKKLKERIESLRGKLNENKIKKDLEEIETINIELDHRSVEISDLNASLQEKNLVITALKDDLRKLTGKALVYNDVTKHTTNPEMLKINVEPITPKLLNKQTAHSAYIKHTQEEATLYRDIVEHVNLKISTRLILRIAWPSMLVWNLIICVKCNGCMLSDNHDLCVLDFINNVDARKKSKSVNKSSKRVWKPTGKVFSNIGYIWIPTGQTFTIIGNACPLTKITTTTKVPIRKPTALENKTHKPIVTLVYSRKPRKSKTNVPISKSKVLKSVSTSKMEPSPSWGSIVSDVPSSSLDECRFSEGNNLCTLCLGDMMTSSPICLLSKASKTKSWLWHRRLSHLNFGAINHLARHGLVRGLPKLKFEKDHLCSTYAMGKSKKKPHKPKSKYTNQEKLYLLHMDLCGPMRVASVNGKKYILVIVDDYSRFTWVKFLRSKDEAPDFIIKFLKMI